MNHLGEVNNNTFGTPMKIVRYGGCSDIDVEFLDEHHYIKKHQAYVNFKSGSIKNPYDRTLFGVGYIGVGKYKAKINGKMTDAYEKWTGIMERCYLNPDKYPAYYGKCIVCDEWHNFQNFAKWFEENRYYVEDSRLNIDKDILFPKCNIYSPKTCLLVPQRINMLFMNKPNNRKLPNGIKKYKSGYLAKCNGEELGIYETVEKAYKVYANKKEEAIREVLNGYEDVLPKEIYDAIYKYRFDIRNDKNYKVA